MVNKLFLRLVCDSVAMGLGIKYCHITDPCDKDDNVAGVVFQVGNRL